MAIGDRRKWSREMIAAACVLTTLGTAQAQDVKLYNARDK
jgi:hypothetical protein